MCSQFAFDLFVRYPGSLLKSICKQNDNHKTIQTTL